MSREDTLRRLFDAFNRRDVDSMVEQLDESVEIFPLRAAVEDISYHGHGGARQFFADNAAIWESMTVDIEEIRGTGDRFLVLGRMTGEGAVSGVRTELSAGWLVGFQGDRITLVRTHANRESALADFAQTP